MLVPLALDAPEIEILVAYASRDFHPRMPRRTQAVLAHPLGLSIDHPVAAFGAERNAVSRWLSRWQRLGLAGHRLGRPPKLPEAAKSYYLPVALRLASYGKLLVSFPKGPCS